MFIRNLWYVAAWSSELAHGEPIGRLIAGELVVLWRGADGRVAALEDRCPHRRAPLSLGRIEGDAIRCMYHGLLFGADGRCRRVPGSDAISPDNAARCFPTAEHAGWIWVWPGDPATADIARLPEIPELGDAEWIRREDALDYAADYQLINDNLTDLSHLDFVHDTTLRAATGGYWSADHPRVTSLADGLLIERWVTDAEVAPGSDDRCEHFNSYRYLLPGLFLMQTSTFPPGTAAASGFRTPAIPPLAERIDRQAVTPMAEGRTRYLYATCVRRAQVDAVGLDAMMGVVNEAFAEDKQMIEAQQRVWDATPTGSPMAFLPQDKAPALFRRLIASRLAAEAGGPERRSTAE